MPSHSLERDVDRDAGALEQRHLGPARDVLRPEDAAHVDALEE
jgi:hypothetical protein